MTQVEIRNMIRRELKDKVKSAEATDQLRWTRAELCSQINESGKIIAQEFLHIQGSKSWTTVAGQANYSFDASDDFLGYSVGIVHIAYFAVSASGTEDHIPLQNYMNFAMFRIRQENQGNTGSPIYWSFWNNQLYIEKPSFAVTNGLRADIYKIQTELATDGTEDATELSGDQTLHPLIAFHAAMMCAREDRSPDLSELLEKKYREEYVRQRRFHAPKVSGPSFTLYSDY